jgi:uncharacterized membrane protein YtjA (UPF0391 family)
VADFTLYGNRPPESSPKTGFGARSEAYKNPTGGKIAMLHYAVVFFIIAIIAAVFGFTGIAAGAAEIAKILFYIFLVVFVVTLLLGVFRT